MSFNVKKGSNYVLIYVKKTVSESGYSVEKYIFSKLTLFLFSFFFEDFTKKRKRNQLKLLMTNAYRLSEIADFFAAPLSKSHRAEGKASQLVSCIQNQLSASQ